MLQEQPARITAVVWAVVRVVVWPLEALVAAVQIMLASGGIEQASATISCQTTVAIMR